MRKDHIKEHINKALAATGPCISHIMQTTGEALPDIPHEAHSYLFKQLLNKQRQFLGETRVNFCHFQNRESFSISHSLKLCRFLCNWTAAVKITVWRKADAEICQILKRSVKQRSQLRDGEFICVVLYMISFQMIQMRGLFERWNSLA